ncbi:MAG: galactose-1-phosphate uridylyltransferase, partial [Deltaproteobacteria bacterium]|nr:galactose-1-phosphate uridylyltransferase [Deltaproteobacteria bacterium]
MTELRKDPIVGRWVIISTERGRRPQDFPREKAVRQEGFCPLCPGSERMTPPEIMVYPNPHTGGDGRWTLRVVPNKFPALRIEGDLGKAGEGIYDKMNGIGAHEVVIETEQHDLDIFDLP